MAQRWRFLPEFIAAGMVPIIYFVITTLGMDSGDAQVYSAAVGALFWATILWWRGQPPLPNDRLPDLTRLRRLVLAALLTILAFLIETLTAEIVLDIASAALNAAGAKNYDAAHVRVVVNRYFAIPIGLCLLFVLGFWAAKKLPMRRPLWWFLGIVLVWYTIRFSLYGVAQAYGRKQGFDLPPFGEAILRTIPIAALSYAALIAGNFFGRRKYGRPIERRHRHVLERRLRRFRQAIED